MNNSIKSNSYRIIVCVGGLALAVFTNSAAAADDYPLKPMRVIIGYLPGGPVDVVLRPLAQKMTEAIGQPFIIENRPGANGNLGAEFVARAAPDGYTLLMGTMAQLTNNPSLYPKLPFDTAKDFAPISLVATSPGAVVVHPSLPAQSLKELIALAKTRPAKLNFSSSGNGSANHLAGELFKMLAGVNMTHVPYKGGGPALHAVVAGEIELIVISLPLSLPFLKANRLRALALASQKRSALWPQLPTTAEAGLPGLESNSGPGMLAPAATPKPIITRLHGEIARATNLPELRERYIAQGLELVANTPDEFAATIRRETARWSKIIKASNITVD